MSGGPNLHRPSKMLNRKRSYSASFFDMGVNSRPRVPFLPRSARDSFAFLKEPCFVKSGNGRDVMTSSQESCTVAEQQNVTQRRSRHNNALDSELKSKRIKRTVSNRLYAQRSRLRKLLYVEKLERNVKAEEARVSWLSLQEPVYQQYQMALKIENNRMKEILGGLEREKAMKQAEFQYLKKELQALRGASMSLLFY